jgi:DNA-binding response OmpR family regulator
MGMKDSGTPDTSKSILYVDDDPALRSIVDDHLREAGFRITTAEDGDVALQLLENERFDLVILDIQMPRMSGIQVLQTMQARDIRPRVIMLTGVNDMDAAVGSVKLGANDYLTKPFEFEQLVSSIRRVLKE